MSKYTIGLDFGTLSGRAVLVNVGTGEEVATAIMEYPHGVIEEKLPESEVALGSNWALQHPQDYLDVLFSIIPEVIEKGRIASRDIIGIGVDFTACTILPVNREGTPLCFYEKYKSNPHSYVKLWKHHAAQPHADKLNHLAKEDKQDFLQFYGGKISSEWMIPKLMEILEESPEIYLEADTFMEAGDWIVFILTGKKSRNCCAAGFKGTWNDKLGYPNAKFLKKLHRDLEQVVIDKKLEDNLTPIGARVGYVKEEIAQRTGLSSNTAVAAASIDAHVAVPAAGVTSSGKMVLIIGTSTCNIMVDAKEIILPGISGVVKDSVLPGYYGYEAGQAAVGDIFDWFIHQQVPKTYMDMAEKNNESVFDLLTRKAEVLKPGESGLLCLDWFNGNRSTLVDADLQGMILGLTLRTKPEEIYRALIEAIAFGQKMIFDTFKENGIKIDEVYACGGISIKNPLLMQIYADILNLPIRVAASIQTVALGSAMFAALAAGSEAGGYDEMQEAAKNMSKLMDYVYKPNEEDVKIYGEIYEEYSRLYHYFGRENHVMKKLKHIKNQQ